MEIISYLVTGALYFGWPVSVAVRNAVLAPFPLLVQAILMPIGFYLLASLIRGILSGIDQLLETATRKKK